MKTLNTLTATAVALAISSAVWAQDNVQNMDPSNMPGYMQNDSGMSPQQMEWMRQQRMNHMQQPWRSQGGNMPMMGGRNGQMMMDPVMRENMMQMRQQKMGQGMRGGMMNPEMMQMRQEHMSRMEKKLSNIESLLQQLLEQQKKN